MAPEDTSRNAGLRWIANDPPMRLSANYGELAEILVESHEHPAFEIGCGKQRPHLPDRSASPLPKSRRDQEPQELPSRLPRRKRPGGVSLSIGGDQRLDTLVGNELVGVCEASLNISRLKPRVAR
jgi:hypothetical protein